MSQQQNACGLSGCFFCKHALPEWREVAALNKENKTFKKGGLIFAEGEPVRGIYFLRSGAVKVHKHWGGQKELTIRFAVAGDVIGLRGLGSAASYSASATALEATKACFISTEFLETSMRVNAALTQVLFQFCATELQRSEKRMSELAHMDVKGRIAEALLAAQEAFGKDGEGYISIPISRQDISAYAGTIYETVFKVFTDWIGAGIIRTEGKRICILDEAGLRGLRR